MLQLSKRQKFFQLIGLNQQFQRCLQRKIQRGSVLVLALGALAGMGNATAEQRVAGPEFSLPGVSAEPVRLSDHGGDVVLVNFFASWCAPCREELPILDRLHQRYQRLGFSVVGVNVDKDRAAADALLERMPVSFPVGFDTTSTVSKQFGVDAMPSTVLIDRAGKVRFVHRGYQPGYEDHYVKQIRQLARESR